MKKEEEDRSESKADLISVPLFVESHNVVVDHGRQVMIIPLASLRADFLDDVGMVLHRRAVRRYLTPGPWRATTAVSPFLAQAAFGSTREIKLETDDAVATYLGEHWRHRQYEQGSYAKFIAPLRLRWVPHKRKGNLQLEFNYVVFNAVGELQSDGRYTLPPKPSQNVIFRPEALFSSGLSNA